MSENIEQRIIEAVNSSGPRLARTLQDLIRFESVVMSDPTKAGPGERLCQEYLAGRLAASQFKTDLWEPDAKALLAKYTGKPGAQKRARFYGSPYFSRHFKRKRRRQIDPLDRTYRRGSPG